MIATRISSNEENLIYPFVLDGDAIDFPIVLSHTHKSVLSEEHEARYNLSWRKLGHGERWGRCKQRRRSRGFFKAPLSEQIVSVILIGEHILVGRGLPKEQWLFSNLPSSPDLTFNIGQIFSGKGKGESNHLHDLDLSGAMLVVIMLVSIIRVMLVVIIAGDLWRWGLALVGAI